MDNNDASAPSLLAEALESYYLLRSSVHERGHSGRTTFRFDGRSYEAQDLDDESVFAPGSRLAAGDVTDLYVTPAWLAGYPNVRLPDPEDDEPLVRIGYFHTTVTSAAVDADPVTGQTLITFRLEPDGPAHRVDRNDLCHIHPDGGRLDEKSLFLSGSYLRELGAWKPADKERSPDIWHEIEYYAHLRGEAEVLEVVDGTKVTFAFDGGGAPNQTYTADLGDPLSVAPYPATTLEPRIGARGRVVLSHFFLTRASRAVTTSVEEPEPPATMAARAVTVPKRALGAHNPKWPLNYGAEAVSSAPRKRPLEDRSMREPKYPLAMAAETRRDAKSSVAFAPLPDPKYPIVEGTSTSKDPKFPLGVGVETGPMKGPKTPEWLGVESAEGPKRPIYIDGGSVVGRGPKHPRHVGAVEAPRGPKRPHYMGEEMSPPTPKEPLWKGIEVSGGPKRPEYMGQEAALDQAGRGPKHPVYVGAETPRGPKHPIEVGGSRGPQRPEHMGGQAAPDQADRGPKHPRYIGVGTGYPKDPPSKGAAALEA